MVQIRKFGGFALLWLTFAALSLGSPMLTITGRNFPIGNGGGFTASIDGNPQIEIFCVDFQNSISAIPLTYAITINNTPAEIAANARFGDNPPWVNQPVDGVLLSAYQRYVLSAWLTTQYNIPAGDTPDNEGIQSAIWSLLAQTGSFPPNLGNRDTWLQNAVNIVNTGTYTNIASSMRVLSDAVIGAGTCRDRHSGCGNQEMIIVTPEPATFVILTGGLAGLMLLRRRQRGA